MSIEFPGDNKLCDHCDAPGIPYEYHGQTFSGLTAVKGERLCKSCRDRDMATHGINIKVQDDRPGRMPYIYNTVRDKDLVTVWIPPELRGIDGRDVPKRKKGKK